MKKYNGFIKLIALCILCPLLIWELSLKNTYRFYRDGKQLDAQIGAIRATPVSDHQTSEPATALPLLSNGKLLDAVDTLKSRVEVMGYTPTLLNENGGDKLYRGTLVLRGDFIALVKTIHALETEQLPVKISSITFAAVKPTGKEKKVKRVELTINFLQIEQ